jgi:purine-binding chemotaxis protein CheW
MSATSTHQLVILTLRDERYALPILEVQEIIRSSVPRSVAATTPWVRGVINLRGTIVPVCDLGLRLGLGNSRSDATTKTVVVDTAHGTIGIMVDDVDEVRTIDHDQIAPAPSADPNAVRGVAKLDDCLVVLLNVEGLFSDVLPAAA